MPADHLDLVLGALGEHHQGEDDLLWPRRRNGAQRSGGRADSRSGGGGGPPSTPNRVAAPWQPNSRAQPIRYGP
ncbi:hypothetical protein [Kitasatospora sp. NPDC088134]|uniref:hypothetical protein n=1 Tax=Kitasatospora sp. NPDC088134 TaxID=3364071 RepID=UPI003807D22D